MSLQAREPDDWRGGRLVPLHKGKTPKWDPQGYRSIFISNVMTKLYHSSLRDHLAAAWKSSIRHIQFGGRQGCSTDAPHLLVQEHFRFAAKMRVPSAAFFVDFKSAFYSVIRQGLFEQQLDDRAFMTAMFRLGVKPEEVAELIGQAQADQAVTGVSAHVQRLLSDLFHGTYFQVDGISDFALTTRGTRPGDPVGDILFNMVMMLILQDVTQHMKFHTSAVWQGEAAPVKDLTQLHVIPDHAWCEIAFVDDLALLLKAPTQNDMHHLAKHAFGAVHEAARTRGLHLNMDAGKKTCLAKDGFLIDVSEISPGMQLRVVHSYKHLGSWVHADGQPRHTLRERVRSAKQSWGPLIRPFFKKSSISVRAKVIVFESLIYSRLLFNVHMLTRCASDLIEKWEAGIRAALAPLVRAQLYGQPPFTFSTITLCGLAEMLAPSDVLHVARLRFAKRLLQHFPQVLWDLIHSGEGDPSSWLSSLRSSLTWLCTFLGPKAPLQSDAAIVDWWTVIGIDEAWSAKIKRAIAACRQFRKAEAQAHVWERHFEATLRQDGACACLDRQADPVRQWICDLWRNLCFEESAGGPRCQSPQLPQRFQALCGRWSMPSMCSRLSP